MYFIVYIKKAKRNVIVPYTWVYGLNRHLQQFLNYGINPNKQHLVFYTDTDNALAFHNNVPSIDFVPDPSIGLAATFPNGGWYKAYIKKVKCNDNKNNNNIILFLYNLQFTI